MNKSMWLLVVFLAACSILLGFALGSNNSEQPANEVQVIVEGRSKTVMPTQQNTPVSKSHLKAADQVAEVSLPQETTQAVEQSETPYVLDTFAIESMANARLNGDDRAPPIGKSVESERPTAEELASPELYLEYEGRQEKKIYKAYIEAADIKVEMLEAQIIKAKEQGLSDEELNVGIEKVKRIRDMKAQLLLDNPELMN